MLIIFLLVFVRFSYSSTLINCRSYSGYILKYFTQDCIETPNFGKNIVEIFHYFNVPYEIHEVTTDDGYILTIFRLPQKHPKATILLQHPLTTDSIIWLIQPENPTAIIFWRAGYDVWLPNNRGTYYSQKHQNLTVDNPKFWNFGFHEIGYYDHFAIIDFIRKMIPTQRKIFFIGHSMSTTTGLIYSSLRRQHSNESIELMILLAPTLFLYQSTALLFQLIKIVIYFVPILNYFGNYRVLNYDSFLQQALSTFLMHFPFKYLITTAICATHGWTPQNIDPLILNRLVVMMPSDFPWKVLQHFNQLNSDRNNEFSMYDYGPKINQKIYKSSKPKVYPLEEIETPIYIIHGYQDYVSSIQGLEILYRRLNESVRYGKRIIPEMAHVDFQIGRFRYEKVYKPIIRVIEKKLKKNQQQSIRYHQSPHLQPKN